MHLANVEGESPAGQTSNTLTSGKMQRRGARSEQTSPIMESSYASVAQAPGAAGRHHLPATLPRGVPAHLHPSAENFRLH